MPELTWRHRSVIKNPDGTFVIVHRSAWGELPYHICSREIDPANLYDLTEVAAFWDSLPEGDPRKALPPPPPEDTRTPEEKRQAAYEAEADPLFELAMYYQAEADGFRLLNDLAKAAEAEEKYRDYLRQYVAKKEEIRARHPDPAEEATA